MKTMRDFPVRAAFVAGVLLPLVGLFLAPTFPAAAVLLILLGVGAALALLLISEMSVLLWLGTSIVMGEGVFLLHTLLRVALVSLGTSYGFAEWMLRVIPLGGTPFIFSLAGFSLLLGVLATFILWRGKWERVICAVTRGDVIFLLAFLPVLVSTLTVSTVNGYVRQRDGKEAFHARGFVGGDTMTLFALTNSQLRTHNIELLRQNPFAGNGPLEYPTLLHRALADGLNATGGVPLRIFEENPKGTPGGDITRVAWWLIVPVLAGTVAVSVLSARYIFRSQPLPWWSFLVLLAALGTTWESFTYPQSHTFLTGLFLLFVLLLVRRDQCEHAAERRIIRFAIGGSAIVLLFSNAVLGTAAVAVAVGSNLLQLFNPRWTRRDRVSGLMGSAILLTLFFLFPPGDGALNALNVAYTAFPQFFTAAALALVVLWALWGTAGLHRSTTLLGMSVLLPALAVATLFFSSRDIVAENSPRFLLLLVLASWPAMISVVQRAGDWWWRQVRHVGHSLTELSVLWSGGVFTFLVLLLPAGASVVVTFDHLVRRPPLVVAADELAAFSWIREQTAADAVFLRAPESLFENRLVAPLSLPAFTGRAQLRSEYWLSSDDAVLQEVRSFFRGKGPAPVGASYLYCGPEISVCPSFGTLVFRSGRVVLHRLP